MVQIIVLAVHLNYETAHMYMKSNVKTNLRSMQVTQERTRHTRQTAQRRKKKGPDKLFHSTVILVRFRKPRSPLVNPDLLLAVLSCLWSQQKAANIITHSIRRWSMQQGAHQKLHKTAHSLPHETWLQKLQKLHVSVLKLTDLSFW